MNYLKNSSGDALVVDLLKVRLGHEARASVQPLLNGSWHIQTIGDPSPKVLVQLLCSYATVQTLIGYASSKESLSISFDGNSYEGCMLDQPIYDIIVPRADRKCIVDFDIAVTG